MKEAARVVVDVYVRVDGVVVDLVKVEVEDNVAVVDVIVDDVIVDDVAVVEVVSGNTFRWHRHLKEVWDLPRIGLLNVLHSFRYLWNWMPKQLSFVQVRLQSATDLYFPAMIVPSSSDRQHAFSLTFAHVKLFAVTSVTTDESDINAKTAKHRVLEARQERRREKRKMCLDNEEAQGCSWTRWCGGVGGEFAGAAR